MPKSSNAIYLLFEQWECLRVTKLFSWARNRNSSQPGTWLNKRQETPWCLLSENTLTIFADLTDVIQNSLVILFSSHALRIYHLTCDRQYQYQISLLIWPALNKLCNYLIIVRWQLGSTGGHKTQDTTGSPEPGHWSRQGKGEVRAQTLSQPWQGLLVNTRNELTVIVLCVFKICLGDENWGGIQNDDDYVSFLSPKPEGSECLK